MFPESRSTAYRAVGFTLIELMIVVAVVALLATVAYPAYTDSVRKARRSDARTALVTASQMMERYNTDKNTYAGATFGPGASDVYKAQSENGYYRLSPGTPTLNTYTLTAVPVGSQGTDKCGTFTLTEKGKRTLTGNTLAAADCQWE
jgi:type IV pilus assembly protein PilE